MGVHGEDVRQGQGGQAEGQHLAHGYIQQRRGKDRRHDQFRLFPFQSGFFLALHGLRRFFLLLRMEGAAEASFLHFRRDLFRAHLAFVVADGHDAGGQIHVATLHAGEPPGHFFHGRAARRAVHPGDVIFFLFHRTSCMVGKYPWGVYLL